MTHGNSRTRADALGCLRAPHRCAPGSFALGLSGRRCRPGPRPRAAGTASPRGWGSAAPPAAPPARPSRDGREVAPRRCQAPLLPEGRGGVAGWGRHRLFGGVPAATAEDQARLGRRERRDWGAARRERRVCGPTVCSSPGRPPFPWFSLSFSFLPVKSQPNWAAFRANGSRTLGS